ncbi:hypothetical protein BpHYR1_048168 [Brachionus plicatilis]|uniref:Uncharacterized protein n=1 Tax=Brachionus plicatilis TaxID=10195 RepID=A0A3M7QH65_BRAPC|nr:hypothetical protein BpHYR1_048168 [Brachionus plicatilis]
MYKYLPFTINLVFTSVAIDRFSKIDLNSSFKLSGFTMLILPLVRSATLPSKANLQSVPSIVITFTTTPLLLANLASSS